MTTTLLYMLTYDNIYVGDFGHTIIVGVWDDPHQLMECYNDLRKQDYRKNGNFSDSQFLYSITEFNPNTEYWLEPSHLTDSVHENKGELDEYVVYKPEEFFDEYLFPKLWNPR